MGETNFDVIGVNSVEIGGVALTSTPVELNLVGNADRVVKVAKVPLANVDTGGGVFSWANDEGATVIVQRVVIDVTTIATGACTLDVGYTATSAVTKIDNLIDGIDIHVAGAYDNIDDKGINGKSKQKVLSGKWVTGSVASGTSAGLVGFAYIEYVVI